MAQKLDSLTQRILDQNRIDTALLIKNDRMGKNARPQRNTVKKNLTIFDEEILKEYQQAIPQTFEYIDEHGETKYRKYQLPNAMPELEEPDELLTDNELKQFLDEKDNDKQILLARYENAKNALQEVNNEIDYVKNEINNGRQKSRNESRRINFELKQLLEREEDVKLYITEVQDEITKIDLEKRNGEEFFTQHNDEVRKISKSNLERVNQYRDELNFLNKGAFSTEKSPDESEMEYLQRLQQNAEIQAPEDQLTDAKALTISRFREKMRELIKDPVIIEQVINTLDSNSPDNVDNKAELLKNWNLLKTKFISTYGVNNRRIKASDIITFFDFFLQKGESGVSKAIEGVINIKNEPVSSSGITNNIEVRPLTDEDMLLLIAHTAGGDKMLFLRSVNDGSNTYLLYSFSGEPTTFKQFFDKDFPYNRKISAGGNGASSKEIENYTGITSRQFNNEFGIDQLAVNPKLIAKKMFEKFGIRSVSIAEEGRADIYRRKYSTLKHGKKDQIEYGMGIPAEDIPQYVTFGNVILLLQKLYYHNQLAVKNQQMKSVAGMRTTKVSEHFVKLIMNMVKGLQPTHSDVSALSSSERQLYDRLIQVAKLNKSVAHQGDKTIADLKHRLKMIEGELEIGNNNPMLKKELYSVLHGLKNFKVITQSQIDKYLKQF